MNLRDQFISKLRWPGILSALLLFNTAYPANYYVSTTGNDLNNGLSPTTPWRTLKKISTRAFAAGDSILLKRGGLWRETLIITSSGLSGKPIVYGAYGTGKQPQINGADLLKTWVLSSGETWVLHLAASPISTVTLMLNGAPLKFLPSVGGLQLNTFTIVRSQTRLSVYLRTNSNPNLAQTEVSVRDYGIYLRRQRYVEVTGLIVANCKYAGIRFDGGGLYSGSNVPFKGYSTISRSHTFNCGQFGIVAGNGYSNTKIMHCKSWQNGNGFYADGHAHFTHFHADTAHNNFRLGNPKTDGNGFGVYKSSHNIIENCVAFDNKEGNGIEVDLNRTDSAILIRFNKTYGNGSADEGYGIKTGNLAGTAGNVVYYNYTALNGNTPTDKIGREISHHIGYIAYFNNCILSTGSDQAFGFSIGDGANVTARNNLVLCYGGERMRYIRIATSSRIASSYNIYMGSSTTGFLRGSTPTSFDLWRKLGYDVTNSKILPYRSTLILQRDKPFTLPEALNAGLYLGILSGRDIHGSAISNKPEIGALEVRN